MVFGGKEPRARREGGEGAEGGAYEQMGPGGLS